jgi:methyl-accepting chemotaxis protein
VKLNNMKIAPKLAIIVGVTLLGLCIAGTFAGYLMQREMMNSKVEQIRSIVEVTRSMALGLMKEVEAGRMTKEAALAEFQARANSMRYDNGDGYLFGSTMDRVTILGPDPKAINQVRPDTPTNGRILAKEWRENASVKGDHTMLFDYMKPGTTQPIPKVGYSVWLPFWNMYLGTGIYINDIDARMQPLKWMLGLSILGIAVIAGGIAWLISRSIGGPLNQLGQRMQELAEGKLDGEIPGIGRGDEVGAMAATVQIFKDNALRMRELEQADAAGQ